MDKNVGSVDLEELKRAREELNRERGIETDPNMYANYNPDRNHEETTQASESNENSSTANSSEVSYENNLNNSANQATANEENNTSNNQASQELTATQSNENLNDEEKDFSVYDNFSQFEVNSGEPVSYSDENEVKNSETTRERNIEENENGIIREISLNQNEEAQGNEQPNKNEFLENSLSEQTNAESTENNPLDSNNSGQFENSSNNDVIEFNFNSKQDDEMEDADDEEIETISDEEFLKMLNGEEDITNTNLDSKSNTSNENDLKNNTFSSQNKEEKIEQNNKVSEVNDEGKLDNSNKDSSNQLAIEKLNTDESNFIDENSNISTAKQLKNEYNDAQDTSDEVEYLKEIDEFNYIDAISTDDFKENGNLTYLLGRNEEGNNVYSNFKDSLNSIFFGNNLDEIYDELNSIILSLMLKNSNTGINFVLFDTNKSSKLKIYNNSSYMFFNRLASTNKEIFDAFSEISNEINSRYDKFATKMVRNLDDYNENVEQEQKLPYIIIVYNNYSSNVNAEYYDEINASLFSTLKLGRLVGVYVIVASNGEIEDQNINYNLPTRASFQENNEDEAISKIGISDPCRIKGANEFIWYSVIENKCLHLKSPKLTTLEAEQIIKNIEN